MSFIQAYVKTNLQVLTEILPSVKRECGGCLPSALTFEESVQRFPEFRHKRNFVVSLLPCDHVESFHQEVLVDVWVLKQLQESEARYGLVEENKFPEEENPLTVYLTHELKDYHDLDLNEERCYLLRGVTPIPLQKITIGALSTESFEWAKEHLKEFLIKSVNNHLVIIKQNGNLGEMFIQSDLYQMLSMLMILECVPVMQGLVTADTMLVVSDIHRDDLDKWQLKRLKSMQGSGKVPHLPLLKMPGTKPAKLTYATIALDEPDSGISSVKEELLNTLLVSLLDVPFHCQNLPNFEHIVDVDNKIWITKATMSAMQLNLGSWVRVSVSPVKHGISLVEDHSHESEENVITSQSNASQEAKPSKIKLAQVFPVEERMRMECIWQDQNSMIVHSNDEEFENGTAYISPVFFFNIIPSPSDDVKSVILSIERAEVRESPPCFATDVSISIIASPLTKITNMYDTILEKHFSKPRLVSPEDVLCVYCDWKNLEVTNSQAALDEGLPRNHMMYFKVIKLTGTDEESLSYFVDAKHLKTFQETNTFEKSYVPAMAELFVRNSVDVKHKQSSYWLTTHPGGLNVHVSKLENVLRSLLINHKATDVFPVLVSGTAGVGKKTVIMAASRRLHLQVVDVNCYEMCGDTTASTEARLRISCAKAFDCAPCILLLSNVHCLGKNKDANDKEPRIVTTLLLNLEEIQRVSPYPVLVLGTTSQPQSMTVELRSCFLDEVEVKSPTEEQRIEMLQALSTGFLIGPGVSFKVLASQTAGMVLADFCTLFSEAVIQAEEGVISYCHGLGLVDEIPSISEERLSASEEKNRYQKYTNLQKDICSAGILLHQCHFDKAIHNLQAAHSDSIGAPKIPNVSWQDIGGLSNVKQEILDTIQLPFQYPEVFAAGLQRSGILLYGPPGTGKTLVAKAVATECSLNFLSVKGPELINMYVGQSEENVREIFATAARAAPCVIFFDELDSLAPNRGRSGDSGGVMDRVVSQLLAELDGIQKSRDVFVIAATNRPDLLDPALLRPGRFDTLLYLGISENKEDRMNILKALTRKFQLSNELHLEDVVDKCPANLTGADFYALCSNALLNAIRRQIQEENTSSNKVELIQDDFEVAIENLVPSVSQEELFRYEKIRWEFTKIKQVHKEIEEELELDGKDKRALTLD